jgi:pyruvyl transferase EpsO
MNRGYVAAGRPERGTDPPAGRDRDLLADLRTSIDKILGPLLPAGTRCALMDFPNSANVGDAAIWMGERAWLERSGIDVVYTCDRFTYSPSRLRKELQDGVILWHGGGNLGDLWPGFQAFRERVVSEFPDNRIVQLPQSVWFGDPANAARASKIFNHHPNLHLLLRDKESLARSEELFDAPSELCTDPAFALDPPQTTEPPVRDVVWLSRTDLESSGAHGRPMHEALTLDWMADTAPHLRRPLPTYAGYVINRLVSAAVRRVPPGTPGFGRATSATYDWRAGQRVARGCRILTMGRVVVTDRLHGHILCCLLGIPHVIVGDRFGKLRSFYDTWTQEFISARFADTPSDAYLEAQNLLARSGA